VGKMGGILMALPMLIRQLESKLLYWINSSISTLYFSAMLLHVSPDCTTTSARGASVGVGGMGVGGGLVGVGGAVGASVGVCVGVARVGAAVGVTGSAAVPPRKSAIAPTPSKTIMPTTPITPQGRRAKNRTSLSRVVRGSMLVVTSVSAASSTSGASITCPQTGHAVVPGRSEARHDGQRNVFLRDLGSMTFI